MSDIQQLRNKEQEIKRKLKNIVLKNIISKNIVSENTVFKNIDSAKNTVSQSSSSEYTINNVYSVQFLNLQRELKKIHNEIQNIMSGSSENNELA